MSKEELFDLVRKYDGGNGAFLRCKEAMVLCYNLAIEKAAETVDDFSIEQNEQNILNLKIKNQSTKNNQ